MDDEIDLNEKKFKCTCVYVRMYKDGKIEISPLMTIMSSIDYNPALSNSPHGYIVVSVPEKDGESTAKYIISQYKAVLMAYLEGFIVGRNIDYISYEVFNDYMKFYEICQQAQDALMVKRE